MGRVSTVKFSGLDARFYSNDHLPPHFHLEKDGEWEVKVKFLFDHKNDVFELVYGKGPTEKQKKQILQTIRKKNKNKDELSVREKLLKEWEEKVSTKSPGEPK
jgi:hypothetical protein